MRIDENIIDAFLTYEKNADIAKAIGKTVRTVQTYRKDAELQKALNERRTEFVKGAVYKMQTSLSQATDVLLKIVNDTATAPQVRINAIQVLFNQCREWTQGVDVLERLQRIEETLNEEE